MWSMLFNVLFSIYLIVVNVGVPVVKNYLYNLRVVSLKLLNELFSIYFIYVFSLVNVAL